MPDNTTHCGLASLNELAMPAPGLHYTLKLC